MRVLNAVRRILLLLVLIPVVAICLDALLRIFSARPRNPIVAGTRDFANVFILKPFKTVFPDQTPLQNSAVTLVALGVLALLIIFLFRGLRSMVGTRPPRPQAAAAPAKKPAPAPPPAPAPATPSATDEHAPDATPDATSSATAADGKSQT